MFQMFEYVAQLLAEEGGNDGRRSLMPSQAVGVGGTHDGGFEQPVMAIDCHERFHDKGDETQVVSRSFARPMQQDSGIGSQ